jgi:hypothetical protein
MQIKTPYVMELQVGFLAKQSKQILLAGFNLSVPKILLTCAGGKLFPDMLGVLGLARFGDFDTRQNGTFQI